MFEKLSKRVKIIITLIVLFVIVILNPFVINVAFSDDSECCCYDGGCVWKCGEEIRERFTDQRFCDTGKFKVSGSCTPEALCYAMFPCEIISATFSRCERIGDDSPTDDPCVATSLLGEDDLRLDILRQYRYNVLEETPEGKELIKLYYQWSPVIVKAMEEDEEFKTEVMEMIDGVLELITEETE